MLVQKSVLLISGSNVEKFARNNWLARYGLKEPITVRYAVLLQKYMMDLTQYQSNVGSLLNKGNALVLSGDLSPEQETELRTQLEQLNQEWEELRVGAMERQTR